MSRETEAADRLGEGGSPEADRQLAENFGMTVGQVREFDPQTLDVARACKFLGLPLKRFDVLAMQPAARARWVDSVARQKTDLIKTFPEASKEMKEMLEAICKFAQRKCLRPGSQARGNGDGLGVNRSNRLRVVRMGLLAAGSALGLAFVAGAVWVVIMLVRDRPETPVAAPVGGTTTSKTAVSSGSGTSYASIKPAATTRPPGTETTPMPPPADDLFQVKSVWISDKPMRVFTVTERKGEKFTATFTIGEKNERVVTGTIVNGKISWLAKDVRAVRGAVGPDTHGTLVGNKIELTWQNAKGGSVTATFRLSERK